MKKLVYILSFLLLTGGVAFAQKYAFVDTEYILSNIPSYKAAQEQLDKISKDFEQEISDRYAEVDKMYKAYQNEVVLLTQDMRKKREDEIVKKEQEVKDLQQKYFGPDGDLFKKREELVKPIQDEIYNAVKEIAVEGNYAVIFDTASGPAFLYTNPRYDLSDLVLKKMGYKD
ncbi:MAG: OmpH family outer membrane protein [Chlorobi bacterium]|nr:OmpH family outer membrane protein [Chlorobiota bacterium]